MEPDSSLRDRLRVVTGPVVLGADGEILDRPDLPEPATPTLLVAPVTDALKLVSDDGFVTGSLDRQTTWRVVAYHLDEATSRQLAEDGIEIDRIFRAVLRMGLAWDARPMDDAP